METHFGILSGCLAVAILACGAGRAETCSISLKAEDAFEQGMGAFKLRVRKEGGVGLYDRCLVEDDGPGPRPYNEEKWYHLPRSTVTKVGGETQVKKILHVDRPGALKAYLWGTAGLAIKLNGQELDVPGGRMVSVSPDLFKQGDNELVLTGKEGKTALVQIASRADILANEPQRKDNPPRSFTSTDGGKTWQVVDGEYDVRLQLIQFSAEGSLLSPILSLGKDPLQTDILAAPAKIESVALSSESQTPTGTAVELLFRSGGTPVYEATSWGEFKPAGAGIPQEHRYLQWKAVLKTGNPMLTPVLKSVTLTAQVTCQDPPAWAKSVQTGEVHNEQILYTSVPFEYEDLDHPQLEALRTKYNLKEVVKGASSEFEALVKLRDWVSHQFKYNPPVDVYPKYDANDILEKKVGFCVQFAIVYMQCCQSLGYNARFVFGNHPGLKGYTTGHEIDEVWSHQYKKWVLMDANANLNHCDAKTGEPLSMLETHDRMIRTIYQGKAATAENQLQTPVYSTEVDTRHGLDLTTSEIKPGESPKKWPRWFKWFQFRYIPRNNWLSKPTPMPYIQGFDWDWSDYLIWEDDQTPKEYEYRNFTSRKADLYWTLDQVRFDAAYGAQPGEVKIQMGTQTPNFETYLVNIDGKGWKPEPAAFTWTLQPGPNQLEMKVRNKGGVEGTVSSLKVTR